jgi:hypothetical protein
MLQRSSEFTALVAGIGYDRPDPRKQRIFSLLYRIGLCAIGGAIIIAVAIVVWLVSFIGD